MEQKRLKAAGFSSTEDLDEYLKKIEKSLQRARNKELGVDENEGKVRLRFLGCSSMAYESDGFSSSL